MLKQKSIIDLSTLRIIDPSAMAVTEVVQGVYCGADIRNGEIVYVGLSEHLRNRVHQHTQQLKRRSKSKQFWDEDFKSDPSILEWRLLEAVPDRTKLNARERHWWAKLNKPRLNTASISSKPFRTGGDTRRKNPGIDTLLSMKERGMTAIEIAHELGVTKTAVYNWFKDAQEPFNHFAEKRSTNSTVRRTDEFIANRINLEKLKAEVASGESFLAISKRYNLDRKRIQKKLEDIGVFGKHTEAYKLDLEQRIAEDTVAIALRKINLYAQSIWNEIGVSSDEANVLIERYNLSKPNNDSC